MDIVTRALTRSLRGEQLQALSVLSKQVTYDQLLVGSDTLRAGWGEEFAKDPGERHGPRIACLADAGPGFVISQWSTWMSRGIFVPLATSHPTSSLQQSISDAGVSMIMVQRQYLDKVSKIAKQSGVRVCVIEDVMDEDNLSSDKSALDFDRYLRNHPPYHEEGALILYTSGTTGVPKGVLHTHGSLASQMESLTDAWEWSANDVILHSLPLHHIHGLVNGLMCAHYNGACVDAHTHFNARSVWRALQEERPTVFMGVPTMYSHMLTIYDKFSPEEQARCRVAAERLRLTVSGSAACPLPVMAAWRELSGSTLLERYGMTEIGMALSNPYRGVRIPGTVGLPLPGVEVRVIAPEDPELGNSGPPSGELRVRGPNLFQEYWNRPCATAEAYDEEGFFLTGDTADELVGANAQDKYFRILGRTSVDIIKSGGYKISALKIENKLLEHPSLQEVVVLGIPDNVYGERIACVATLREGCTMTELELMTWATDELPPYEIPRHLLILSKIPRNAMGKVNKKELKELYLSKTQDGSS